MKAVTSKLIFCILLLCLAAAKARQQLSNDSPAYFGGVGLNDGYLDWIDEKSIASRYDSSLFLAAKDPSNGAAVHWKINGDYIDIAVAARATGWVGFGIGEVGGMKGADIVYFQANQPETLTDAHVLEALYPYPDDCQHWTFVDSMQTSEFTMFEGRRLLNTGDAQDHEIYDDTADFAFARRIIAAWGDQEQIGYHGSSSVARGTVRFYGKEDEHVEFHKSMEANSDGFFDMRADEYLIPDAKTKYAYFCFTREDLIAKGVPDLPNGIHVIGVEPIITPGHEHNVHHAVLSASSYQDTCGDVPFPTFIYGFAVGTQPWTIPEFLGYPLVGRGDYKAYSLEMHYNNPDGDLDKIDSSGVRFYYTTTPRSQELGIVRLADPYLKLLDQPVGDGLTSHSFYTPSGCSESSLSGPITIMQDHIHMHETGVRGVSEIIRDGETIRKSSVDVWDFDQQGIVNVWKEETVVRPGDSFKLSCFYRSSKGEGRKFGVASEDEMCFSIFYYYPRSAWAGLPSITLGLDMPTCVPTHENVTLDSDDQLNRTFGVGSSVCDKPPQDTSSDLVNEEHPATKELSGESKYPKAWTGIGTNLGYMLVMALALVVPITLFAIIGASPSRSRKWKGFVSKVVHRPVLKCLRYIAELSAKNPIRTLIFIAVLSAVLVCAGLATNFRFEVDEVLIWTPIGASSREYKVWTREFNEKQSLDENNVTVPSGAKFYLLFHNHGENLLDRESISRIFETLDSVRNLSMYDELCSPSCFVNGVTQFWDSNTTLFESEIATDEDAISVLSAFTYPSGIPVDSRDFGYAQRDFFTGDQLLTSVVSYTVDILFPSGVDADDFIQEALDTVLDLQKEWKDEAGDRSLYAEVDFAGSYNDEYTRAVLQDLPLLPVAFFMMSMYVAFMFSKRAIVRSRALLGLGAVATCFLSVASGMGLMFIIGVEMTMVTQLLPFIVLGIGLDDAFVIMGSYERTAANKDVVERILETINDIGLSISTTTLTSCLAFALGSFSAIPAVRWMSLYAFPMILIDFLYQVSFFVALIVLDEHRIEQNRRDICICIKVDDEVESKSDEDEENLQDKQEHPHPQCVTISASVSREIELRETAFHRNDNQFRKGEQSKGSNMDGFVTNKGKSVSGKFMAWYAEKLLQTSTKVVVAISFSVLACMCAYSTSNLEQQFSYGEMMPGGSYAARFADAYEKYSSHNEVRPTTYYRDVDQWNEDMQHQMSQYVRELEELDQFGRAPDFCWFQVINTVALEADKQEILKEFSPAVNRDTEGKIESSACQLSMSGVGKTDTPDIVTQAFRAVQAVTEKQPINQGRKRPAFFTYSSWFDLWEFFLVVVEELILTTVGAVVAICLVTSIFIPHWSAPLLIAPITMITYIDLLGFIQWVGLHINPITYISLVASVGLGVDYLVHVLVRYYETAGTRREKTVEALETLGISVLQGGFSTFLGALPLLLSTTPFVTQIFIVMLGIVVLGLAHGLILLPVILATFGPEEQVINLHDVQSSDDDESTPETSDDSLPAEGSTSSSSSIPFKTNFQRKSASLPSSD